MAIAALAVACLLAGLGCARMADVMGDAPRGKLEAALDHYTNLVRWGKTEMAQEWIDPAVLPEYREIARGLRDVRMTGVTHTPPEAGGRSGEYRVVVRYRGFWLSSPYEREVEIQQTWRRDPQTGRWLVSPDLDRLREVLQIRS